MARSQVDTLRDPCRKCEFEENPRLDLYLADPGPGHYIVGERRAARQGEEWHC